MKIHIKNLDQILNIFRIISKHEPLYLIVSFFHIILSSVIIITSIYIPKLFIGGLELNYPFEKILIIVLIYILFIFSLKIIDSGLTNKCTLYSERFFRKIRGEVGKLTMEKPLSFIEGSDFGNKLSLTNNMTETTSAINVFQNIVSHVLTIIGLIFVILKLDFLCLISILIVLIIKILFVYFTYKYRKNRRIEYASNDKIGNYLNAVAYKNQGTAKEIRINNLRNWFMTKIKGYREEMLNMQYEDFNRFALFECVSEIVVAIQSFLILWILTSKVISGELEISDFSMYFSTITTLTMTLSSIITLIGEFNRYNLNIKDFESIFSPTPQNASKSIKDLNGLDIVFHDVWFSYPNTETYVLKGINIRISKGEKLSIVGINGAGKSTFIKLLCRFYRPTKGKITIGGIDISELDYEEYSKLLSAVFQDYQIFSFSMKENIFMKLNSQEDISDLLEKIKLSSFIDNLPMGVDTPINRNFETNGIELSGGMAQKIALARAICQESPILILDEPTAALDPKSENEIYESYFKIAENKTTIFISHRLASSTFADKIVFFENGEITEYGSHHELMSAGLKYCELFSLQKESYNTQKYKEDIEN